MLLIHHVRHFYVNNQASLECNGRPDNTAIDFALRAILPDATNPACADAMYTQPPVV